jgi:hypothetical protein
MAELRIEPSLAWRCWRIELVPFGVVFIGRDQEFLAIAGRLGMSNIEKKKRFAVRELGAHRGYEISLHRRRDDEASRKIDCSIIHLRK